MRWIIRILGLCVALIIMAVALVAFLPAERLGRIASERLSAQLGRDVVLRDVSVSLYPVLGLDAGGIEVANPDWAGDGALLRAERAQIGVDAMDALQRRLTVRRIVLTAPQVALVQAADGRVNWDFGADQVESDRAAGTSERAAAPTSPPSVDALVISDGRVTYRAGDAAPVVIEDIALQANWPDRAGPMQFDLSLRAQGASIAMDGALRDPAALMAGGDSAAQITLRAGGGRLALDGAISPAPGGSGQLSLQSDDLSAMMAALGVGGVSLPAGFGPGLSLDAQMYLAPDQVALRAARMTSGATQVTGEVDVALGGARPVVTARLDMPVLDLSAAGGSGGGGGSGSSGSEGWSKDRIDASALGLIDGAVAINITEVRLPQATVGPLAARVSVDRARAVVDVTRLAAFGGQVAGQFVANNRDGLSVRATLNATDVALRPALSAFAGINRLEGQAGFAIDVLGSGVSLDAIMRSLDGTLSLDAGPGVFTGLDLNAVFSGGSPSGGTTVFDSLTGSFAVTDGVMRGDDLRMGLPRLETRGEGRINLGEQSLDYLLSVIAPEARNGRGLEVPVRLKGPWSDVGISADLQEAIDRNLAEERRALEQQVRDRAEEEIGNRLGVTPEEGQSLEDAVRDRLENEARDGLRRLLGR